MLFHTQPGRPPRRPLVELVTVGPGHWQRKLERRPAGSRRPPLLAASLRLPPLSLAAAAAFWEPIFLSGSESAANLKFNWCYGRVTAFEWCLLITSSAVYSSQNHQELRLYCDYIPCLYRLYLSGCNLSGVKQVHIFIFTLYQIAIYHVYIKNLPRTSNQKA